MTDGRGRHAGEFHFEHRSASRPRARCPDLAVVGIDDAFANRQTETETAPTRRHGMPFERCEETADDLAVHSDSGITDDRAKTPRRVVHGPNLDTPAVAEFDRVRQQVPEHLPEPGDIAADVERGGFEI